MTGASPFVQVPVAGFPALRRVGLSNGMIARKRSGRMAKCPVATCFYIFAAFCVLPFLEIPLIGLSFTAPLFLIVAGAAVLRPARRWFPDYNRWISLAGFIWVSLLLGMVMHLGITDLLPTARVFLDFTYWLVVFLGTAHFASTSLTYNRITTVLAISVSMLAVIRLFEALALGSVGAWSGLVLQSQNNYAILFTTFSPFLLIFLVSKRWRHRLLALLGLLVVWTAAVINGSRGCWAGMAIGTLVFTTLFTCSKPRRAWFLWIGLAFVSVCVAALVISSEIARSTFSDRWATLSSLENEKSFMVRQYLNQKSWALFEESPLFGVGLGQYQEAHANIEIPPWYKGRESEFDKRSSHNSYLSLLAETGLAGAIPFAIFLLVLIGFGGVAAVRLTRRGHIWALGIFVGFISMAIHMWAISSLTNTATWFVYGLAASLVVVARRKQPRVTAFFPQKAFAA